MVKVELTHLHPRVVPACSAETEKVFKVSSEENLQPFKDNMDTFLSQGETLMASFQDVSDPVKVLPVLVLLRLLSRSVLAARSTPFCAPLADLLTRSATRNLK